MIGADDLGVVEIAVVKIGAEGYCGYFYGFALKWERLRLCLFIEVAHLWGFWDD